MRKFFDWLFTTRSGDFSSVKKEARRLPDTMPSDFRIRIAEFEITNNTVVANSRSDGRERNFQFQITPHQMENVFRVLKENKFDRIKIIEDIRLDAGSEFIHTDWGNTFLSKGSSQTCYIDKKWEEQYDACYSKLLQALRDAADSYLKPLKIVLDEKIKADQPGYYIGITDSLTPYYFMTEFEQTAKQDFPWREQSDETKIIPGYTELTVSHLAKSSPRNQVDLRVNFPEGNYNGLKLHIYKDGDRVLHKMEYS